MTDIKRSPSVNPKAAAAAVVTTRPTRDLVGPDAGDTDRTLDLYVCSDCVVLWHMFIRASLLQDLVYCKCAGFLASSRGSG